MCWKMRKRDFCHREGRGFAVSVLVLLLFASLGCHRLESDWEKAQAQNTIQAYEQFLRQHSEGPFAVKAQERVTELAWNSASQKNTLQAYQDFVNKYPQSAHVSEANDKSKALIGKELDRAYASIDKGMAEQAQPILDDVLKIDPENPFALVNAAYVKVSSVMKKQGEENKQKILEEALACLAKALPRSEGQKISKSPTSAIIVKSKSGLKPFYAAQVGGPDSDQSLKSLVEYDLALVRDMVAK